MVVLNRPQSELASVSGDPGRSVAGASVKTALSHRVAVIAADDDSCGLGITWSVMTGRRY